KLAQRRPALLGENVVAVRHRELTFDLAVGFDGDRKKSRELLLRLGATPFDDCVRDRFGRVDDLRLELRIPALRKTVGGRPNADGEETRHSPDLEFAMILHSPR